MRNQRLSNAPKAVRLRHKIIGSHEPRFCAKCLPPLWWQTTAVIFGLALLAQIWQPFFIVYVFLCHILTHLFMTISRIKNEILTKSLYYYGIAYNYLNNYLTGNFFHNAIEKRKRKTNNKKRFFFLARKKN